MNKYLKDRDWEFVPCHDFPSYRKNFSLHGKEASIYIHINDGKNYSITIESDGWIDPHEPHNYIDYRSSTASLDDVAWEAEIYISTYGD